MATEKELQLKEAYNYYFKSLLDSSFPLNRIEEYFAKNMMGFGTAIEENIFSVDDILTVIIHQREQSAGIKMDYVIKPAFHHTSGNGNVAIFVDEVTISMNISSKKHYIFIRHTLVIEYLNNEWKILHFHTSIPVQAESETDTWGIEEWKKRNHELEMQVKERTAELERSLETLKSAQAQLIQSEKLASLGELTAGIAHEIQNPLNFVNNFSELSVGIAQELEEEIKNSPLTPKGGIIIEDKTYFNELLSDLSQNQEKINHHGKRAASIVKGMLEHSKASTGKKERTDINALVDEYTRLAYSNQRSKNEDFTVDIETHLEDTIPQINIIPQDIGRVLLNLMNNAFWAVQEQQKRKMEQGMSDYKPTVTLSTKAERNQIFISVKDNGIGMSEATKAKIFQPFFTTKPTGEGTGLGLSLAYDIVNAYGGSLSVQSDTHGSNFIFTLLKT